MRPGLHSSSDAGKEDETPRKKMKRHERGWNAEKDAEKTEKEEETQSPSWGRDPVPFTGTKSAKQLNELTKNMAGKGQVGRKLHYDYFLILC